MISNTWGRTAPLSLAMAAEMQRGRPEYVETTPGMMDPSTMARLHHSMGHMVSNVGGGQAGAATGVSDEGEEEEGEEGDDD